MTPGPAWGLGGGEGCVRMHLLVQERGGGGVLSGGGPKVHGVGAEPVLKGLPTVPHSVHASRDLPCRNIVCGVIHLFSRGNTIWGCRAEGKRPEAAPIILQERQGRAGQSRRCMERAEVAAY